MQGADGFVGQRAEQSPALAALGKCSADTALRDISDLLARGVLGGLEGVGAALDIY